MREPEMIYLVSRFLSARVFAVEPLPSMWSLDADMCGIDSRRKNRCTAALSVSTIATINCGFCACCLGW